jgi:hypothetical protein
MKILYIQQIMLPFQYPLFLIHSLALGTTSVAATVVMHLDMPASGACSHMTSQHIGAAFSDVSNQFLLFKAQQTMLLVLIGKAIEHFGHIGH